MSVYIMAIVIINATQFAYVTQFLFVLQLLLAVCVTMPYLLFLNAARIMCTLNTA